MSGINPFDSSIGPIQGPGFVPPPPVAEDTELIDILNSSSVSQSMAEAIMVYFLMSNPVLPQPDQNLSYSAEAIGTIVSAEFAKIGSEMWDRYLDHLEQEKERIAEYLSSPKFQQWVEDQTLEGKVKEEISTPIDTKSPVRSATEYEQYLKSQGVSSEFVQNEMKSISAIGMWSDMIDGVANYIKEQRESNPAAAMFVVASFAITSSYIGNYANIVDVVSTEMVTVKPIQDAVANILPVVPQQFQEQLSMVINLFAIGLINFSNAEAIVKSQQGHKPPSDWKSVVAFAHNVLDKVKGNMVNAFLMAILVNNMENLGSTQEERNTNLTRLAAMAKAVMISVAIAALHKAAMPDIRLTADIFLAMFNNELVAKSEEDKVLVDELAPLIEHLQGMKENGEIDDNVINALAKFFGSDPSIEALLNPKDVYTKAAADLPNSEDNPVKG